MRVRTRGSISQQAVMLFDRIPGVSCADRAMKTYTFPVADVYLGKKQVTMDELTPGYRRKVKRGEWLPINPFTTSISENKSVGGSYSVYGLGLECTGPDLHYQITGYKDALIRTYRVVVGIPTNVILIAGSDAASLYDEVVTKALADRFKGEANFVESLAELDKTVGMLQTPLGNVVELIKAFRRNGKRRKGYAKVSANSKDFIRFLSSEWLRFRYGITPLVNDIQAIMKALERGYEKAPSIHKSRASGTKSMTKIESTTVDSSPFRYTFQIVRADTCDMRAVVFDSYRLDAFDYLGLTFKNVVTVPWELVKFSFVADWFANIGDLIYANVPRIDAVCLGSAVTSRRNWSASYSCPSTVNIDPTHYSVSGLSGGFVMTNHETVRSPGGGGKLVIRSDFRLDQFKRSADASALVVQWLSTIGF